MHSATTKVIFLSLVPYRISYRLNWVCRKVWCGFWSYGRAFIVECESFVNKYSCLTGRLKNRNTLGGGRLGRIFVGQVGQDSSLKNRDTLGWGKMGRILWGRLGRIRDWP